MELRTWDTPSVRHPRDGEIVLDTLDAAIHTHTASAISQVTNAIRPSNLYEDLCIRQVSMRVSNLLRERQVLLRKTQGIGA